MAKKFEVSEKGIKVLSEALECWNAGAEFRKDRLRNKRYTYGKQWHDLVEVDGVMMREEDYIRMQGNIPLKNNLIRRLVRNVVGVFRNTWKCPGEENDPALDDAGDRVAEIREMLAENNRHNRLEEVYARSMEEFLISGLAVHRKWYGLHNGRSGCLTEPVSPDRFFFDTGMADFRGWDAKIVGEIHDLSFPSLCASFADSPETRERLRTAYAGAERCRVVEVWRKETAERYCCHDPLDGSFFMTDSRGHADYVEAENRRRKIGGTTPCITARWRCVETWRFYFITPEGAILQEGDSPYGHGEHPFVFKAYPFIDGEIHSFVSDVIDQQRHTNRLVTLYDWVMRSTAKGVLLFPEDSLPDGVEIDDISDEWSRFNGVILFRPRPGIPLPQQVTGNAANIGISDLLNLQLKLFEDISGVNSALQGKLENNSVSGTLFSQQTRNALTSLADILSTFADFIGECTRKDISNMLTFSFPS